VSRRKSERRYYHNVETAREFSYRGPVDGAVTDPGGSGSFEHLSIYSGADNPRVDFKRGAQSFGLAG